MKDRIRQIMESQKMTQQEFSDYIGKSAATLSGIFTGRTRPTLDMVDAIKVKFPNINTDWLIFGKEPMYIHQPGATSEAHSDPQGVQQPMLDFDHPASATPSSDFAAASSANALRSGQPQVIREEIKYIDKPQRHVTEIRVYYDDQTWESFVPSKK